mmetsp:Transcript_17953/g.28094  ORF Transcript_17953/g.28094 Transcript_17953/m.28094 type:complete len:207 (-) Transcript_17953:35-655(-)
MTQEPIDISKARRSWSIIMKSLDTSSQNLELPRNSEVSYAQSETSTRLEHSIEGVSKPSFYLNGIDMPFHDMSTILTSSFSPLEHIITQDSLLNDSYIVEGKWRLQHVRTLIGWEATRKECSIPYSASLFFNGTALQKVDVRSKHVQAFIGIGMPNKLQALFENKQVLKMFCALRSVGVKPEVISYNALLGASLKKPSWANAMHLM